MGARLEAHGLFKRYHDASILEDISLHAEAREVVGLLGPNGAGKSTCFYLIAGLLPCDAGNIRLDDRDITDMPMSERARQGIGYLPQEASVFRRLTVAENLLGVLELHIRTREECKRQLEELLEEFEITNLRNQYGHSLSGGERRRVEIARALAAEPSFLLLDEPFAGIDPLHVASLKSIIQHLRERGLGIIITDHNVRETLSICNRAYILSERRILACGEPGEILGNPQVRTAYLGEDFRL